MRTSFFVLTQELPKLALLSRQRSAEIPFAVNSRKLHFGIELQYLEVGTAVEKMNREMRMGITIVSITLGAARIHFTDLSWEAMYRLENG